MIQLNDQEFLQLPSGTQIHIPFDPRNATINHPNDNLPEDVLDYKCLGTLRQITRPFTIELLDDEILITFR